MSLNIETIKEYNTFNRTLRADLQNTLLVKALHLINLPHILPLEQLQEAFNNVSDELHDLEASFPHTYTYNGTSVDSQLHFDTLHVSFGHDGLRLKPAEGNPLSNVKEVYIPYVNYLNNPKHTVSVPFGNRQQLFYPHDIHGWCINYTLDKVNAYLASFNQEKRDAINITSVPLADYILEQLGKLFNYKQEYLYSPWLETIKPCYENDFYKGYKTKFRVKRLSTLNPNVNKKENEVSLSVIYKGHDTKPDQYDERCHYVLTGELVRDIRNVPVIELNEGENEVALIDEVRYTYVDQLLEHGILSLINQENLTPTYIGYKYIPYITNKPRLNREPTKPGNYKESIGGGELYEEYKSVLKHLAYLIDENWFHDCHARYAIPYRIYKNPVNPKAYNLYYIIDNNQSSEKKVHQHTMIIHESDSEHCFYLEVANKDNTLPSNEDYAKLAGLLPNLHRKYYHEVINKDKD